MTHTYGDTNEAVAFQLYGDCRALNVGAYGSAEHLLALFAECAAIVGASVPAQSAAGGRHSVGPTAYGLYLDCKALNPSAYASSDKLLELFAGCAAIVAAGAAAAEVA